MKEEQQFKKGFEYIKKMHKGQFRAGKAPVWQHLLRVSQILKSSFEITHEGTSKERFDIYFSALGHDLIEDTSAKEQEIKRVFGSRGLYIINGMTNSWGDKEKTLYIKKVCNSEEAIRLVKLADLIDNYTHVSCTISLLGWKWVKNFFLPIVVPMRKAIVKTRFKKFKNTADLLFKALYISVENLDSELKRLR